MDDDDRAPPHEGREGSPQSEEVGTAQASGGGDYGDGAPSGLGEGPISLKGVFLGNLQMSFSSEQVIEIFAKPIIPPDVFPKISYKPIAVDRLDLKRGYCFVFLKDVANMAEKEQVERFVSDINGMAVPNVSTALRAEFARGDGRVKRKEDERRRNIQPSETLFVVNFHEETTKKGDLEMLFGPFGELVRIDMKGNYAFVQFRSIEESMRAKEATNGGKLDQSVLTVEYVANRRGDRDRPRGGPGGGADGRGGGGWRDRGDRRNDDRRGGPPSRGGGPPPTRQYSAGGRHEERSRDRGRDEYRGGGRGGGDSRYDEERRSNRDRSPPGGYRRRSRSRSYSPPRNEDRSRYDRNDRYEGGSGGAAAGAGGGGWRGGDRRRSRSRSRDRDRRAPSPAGNYRDRDGDRGDLSYRNERGYRG